MGQLRGAKEDEQRENEQGFLPHVNPIQKRVNEMVKSA